MKKVIPKEATEDMRTKPNLYMISAEEVIAQLHTSMQGLTQEQVEDNQKKYGKNLIEESQKGSILIVFGKNFIHLMALLLWIGGIVAFIAGMKELAIAIWLVNVINGSFSFWQEYRAGKATEALKKMLPAYARVIRNGIEVKILAEDLTVGDMMILEEGDKISADARLILTNGLRVDQSTLTGESNPVRKLQDAVLSRDFVKVEIPNLIFAGTHVAEGNAKAIVTEVGMRTEFGKIANLTQNMGKEISPLQKKLNRLTKQISFMAIGFGVFFFLSSVFIIKQNVATAFIFALGMIVAFIPEGLLPTVTLSLAMAVQRMSKRHALVKKLSSVEALGSTTVICTDKTGTLTQNEMTVSNLWMKEKEYTISGVGYAPNGEVLKDGKVILAAQDENLALLLKAAALCSNARILEPDAEQKTYRVIGDPTEACLGVAAAKAGIDMQIQAKLTPRVKELPFESRRKRMTTIHKNQGNDKESFIAYTKGAPKEVINLCTTYIGSDAVEILTDEIRKEMIQANDSYAKNGLRVLAVAMRSFKIGDNQDFISKSISTYTPLSTYTPENVEQELTFIGLIAMADPPRREVKEAVEECHRAGIRIIMITGDYGLTAESIAKRIGIVKDFPQVITGIDLQDMKDEALKEALQKDVIFARVVPEQKLRVVQSLQELGEVVAVTGDGVNDSPALKRADIGVAMGISGTDVAKEAADMILTDDNFASIVHAIEEGRAVYSNIQKFMLYILNSNVPEAFPSALFLFSKGAIPLPLTLMQILAIDLGTDMLPALGLGTEKPEKGTMDAMPRSQKEPLLTKKLVWKAFLWYGLLEAAVLTISYFFVNYTHGWPFNPLAAQGSDIYQKATTMSLASIVFCQIAAVFNSRTESESVFRVGLFSNRQINIGIITEVLLMMILSYAPFLQFVFQTAPLDMKDWMFLCIWPPLILLFEEGRKWFLRKKKGQKNAQGKRKTSKSWKTNEKGGEKL